MNPRPPVPQKSVPAFQSFQQPQSQIAAPRQDEARAIFEALIEDYNAACERGDLDALAEAENSLHASGATIRVIDGLELWQPPSHVPRSSFEGWSNPPRDDGLTWMVFDYQLEINGRIIDRSNDVASHLDFARWSMNDTFDPHGLLRVWRIRRLADGVILAEFHRKSAAS